VIRAETPEDVERIRRVHIAAFGRDAEANLVDRLRADNLLVASVVAEDGADIVGHVLFSDLPISTADETLLGVALAPLAVLPAFQRKGIGSRLVHAGIGLCRERRKVAVVVLGDPRFYRRFGFTAALTAKLRGPFSGDHWLALELEQNALQIQAGHVSYPAAFELVK